MSEDNEPQKNTRSRRQFLKSAGLTGALVAAGAKSAWPQASSAEAKPENLPPHVADWSKHLGAGVADRPYGKPSKFEAHVVRRDV